MVIIAVRTINENKGCQPSKNLQRGLKPHQDSVVGGERREEGGGKWKHRMKTDRGTQSHEKYMTGDYHT